MLVQTLVGELPIEALNVAVVRRFSGLTEQQLHAVFISPRVHLFGAEFSPVVHANCFGLAPLFGQSLQGLRNPHSRLTNRRLK